MAFATGVNKSLRYKVESAWGTAPGATGAQVLRRVSSDLSLKKKTYESNEVTSHLQRVDFRHGVRSVGGVIRGELSPGTYKDFVAAAVARAWAAVTSITGLSITIAGSGPTYTVTRGAGSFLTDGIKAGDVVRLTAGSFNAANLNKNLLVCSLTAAVLTVMPLNGVALVAEGPIASSTVAVPGKKTYAPASSHTDLSYAIEHWYSDISQSELFTGCKVAELGIAMPASGMATIDIGFLGKDVTTDSSAYYSSPTAETATGILAACNGLLLAQGGAIALITSLNLRLRRAMEGAEVAGSNALADITEGRILVDGSFTAFFQDATLRDYFLNETEVALVAALSASNSASADFISVTLPRIKLGSADKDDGDKALVQSHGFTALYKSDGGAGTSSEQSTIVFQDSQA